MMQMVREPSDSSRWPVTCTMKAITEQEVRPVPHRQNTSISTVCASGIMCEILHVQTNCGHSSSHTLFLMLQWQQTVHRYLRVLHSRMMKRPPKNVTMEEARNAHHMRCPLLSQGTSDEKGMTTSSILDIKIEESGFILLLILLVLIELSLPWGTVPSASASI